MTRDREPRRQGRATELVLLVVNSFTGIASLVLLILGYWRLWDAERFDVLGLMGLSCAVFWLAAVLGPAQTILRRLIAETLIVLLLVVLFMTLKANA